MLDQADEIDQLEGQMAYCRYNEMMQRYADEYDFPLTGITAAFCSLSPNNDYVGNLRSLTSVLNGLNVGTPHDKIVVSTYNHCKDRAIKYLLGQEDFVTKTRGPKILSFYENILNPMCSEHVTIDGHMVAAYVGDPNMNMKEALVNKSKYFEIVGLVKEIAKERSILSNQVQAIIWFTRKRIFNIKFNPNMDLFQDNSDIWKIIIPLDHLPGYGELQ